MSDAVLDGETLVGFSRAAERPVFRARCAQRQDAVDQRAPSGHQRRHRQRRRVLVCAEGRWRAVVSPWKTSAFEPLRRYPVANERHVGATGHRRQSRLRERPVDAGDVDIQLNRRAVRAILIAAVVSSAIAIAAQEQASKPWRAPTTADGRPDLQGVWTNATLTPLERPARFAGRFMTEAEAAELESQAVTTFEQQAADRGQVPPPCRAPAARSAVTTRPSGPIQAGRSRRHARRPSWSTRRMGACRSGPRRNSSATRCRHARASRMSS